MVGYWWSNSTEPSYMHHIDTDTGLDSFNDTLAIAIQPLPQWNTTRFHSNYDFINNINISYGKSVRPTILAASLVVDVQPWHYEAILALFLILAGFGIMMVIVLLAYYLGKRPSQTHKHLECLEMNRANYLFHFTDLHYACDMNMAPAELSPLQETYIDDTRGHFRENDYQNKNSGWPRRSDMLSLHSEDSDVMAEPDTEEDTWSMSGVMGNELMNEEMTELEVELIQSSGSHSKEDTVSLL